MTLLISPLRLISKPICRLISLEIADNWRARSLVIIFSGGIPLYPRRSSCLMCAAFNPVAFPEILLITEDPLKNICRGISAGVTAGHFHRECLAHLEAVSQKRFAEDDPVMAKTSCLKDYHKFYDA